MPKLAEFSIAFNVGPILEQTDYLRHQIESGVIAATQAGAQVFYDEVKQRAQGFANTGNLARAIYQYRNKDEQRPGHAQYKISWRKGGKQNDASAEDNKALGALPNASHGVLVEYGYIQRYASYVGSDGQWYTAIRPEKRGQPAPRSRASQAEKDKYYVLRKGGPVQWLPRSFLRAGFEAAKNRALEAASLEMTRQINKGRL